MSNIIEARDEIAIHDVSVGDLENKNKAEIEKMARGVVLNIAKKISKIQEALEEAKELNELTKDMESDLSYKLSFGLFGKSALEKKVDIMTQTQAMHLEITDQVTHIQNLTIALCMSHAHFTKHTLKEFDSIIKNGFKDSDGKIQRLSEAAKSQMKLIQNEILEKKKEQKSNNLKFYMFGFLILAAVIFVVAMFIIKK